MPIPIFMPALSPTMEQGKLAKWLVKEGDAVASGDVIAEIETDKATMEVEAVEEGTVGRILVPEGTDGVAVNAPIAILLGDGEDKSALDAAPKPACAAGRKQAEARRSAKPPCTGRRPQAQPPAAPAKANGANGHGGRIFASPLARRVAKEKAVDLAALDRQRPAWPHRHARCREGGEHGRRRPRAPAAASPRRRRWCPRRHRHRPAIHARRADLRALRAGQLRAGAA